MGRSQATHAHLLRVAGTALVAAACLAAPTGALAAVPASGVTERTEEPWASDAPQADPLWRNTTQSIVRLRVPLGAAFPAHPAACDWISYLRYRTNDGPTDPAQADAVYVAMPGIFEGASAFDIVARNMIGRAAQAGKRVEVWAVDRRSNCLEDRVGIEAARRSKDVSVALDYYFNGALVDGQRYEDSSGTTTSTYRDDLHGKDAFLKKLGTEQTLADYYAVIADGFPDPALRKRKVVCGGHSLGGWLTGLFSAWDFDGRRSTTDDAGFNQCAGFLQLDTLTASRVRGKLPNLVSAITGTSNPLRTNAYLELPVINPQVMRLLLGAAANAYWYGDAESTLQRRLPLTRRIREAIPIMFSENLWAFLQGGSRPNPTQLRMTANALFGFLVDDNSFNVSSIAQVSMGYPNGGPLAKKNFPVPNLLVNIPSLRNLTGNLGGAGRLIMPTPNQRTGPDAPLYGWSDFNHLTPVRYTTPEQEVADMRQVARSFFEPPVDFVELYMPTLLSIESQNALFGLRPAPLAKHLLWEDLTASKPALNILAGDGPMRTAIPFVDAPGRKIVIPGYTHLDPLVAAPTQNNGAPEIGSAAAADFLGTIADVVE